MTSPKKPSWSQPVGVKKVLLLIVVGVVTQVAVRLAYQAWKDSNLSLSNPYSTSSPMYEPFDRFTKKITQLPEFREKVKNTTSPDEMAAWSMQLSSKGLRKLDNASLLKRTEIMALVLSKIDSSSCAAIVNGKTSKQVETQLFKVLEQLDSKSINDWFDLSFAALELSLKNNAEPPIAVDSKILEEAFRDLLSKLPRPEAEKLVQVLSSVDKPNQGRALSDADICTGGRILFEQTLKLEPRYQEVMARVLVQG